MWSGPTVDLVSNHLVACYGLTCEIYQEGSWQHLQNTTVYRDIHSSATTKRAVLLIGGFYANTTEWIPVDGSPAQPGPFTVRHGSLHCSIQTSDDAIVVTGGQGTESFVTEYQLADGTETHLVSLRLPRYAHACGVYQGTDDELVSFQFSYFLNSKHSGSPRHWGL